MNEIYTELQELLVATTTTTMSAFVLLIFLMAMYQVYAYEPHCHSCKWFIPSANSLSDYGLCRMFKNTFNTDKGNVVIYDYAKHCRSNEHQCGKTGWLFDLDEEDTEEYDEIIVNEMEEKEIDRLWEKYKEMNEELNAELHDIDLDELDEIESIIRKLQHHH